MWLRWLYLFLIIVGIVLSGFFAWYESAHQSHTAGYREWVPIAMLVILGIVELVKQLRDDTNSKGRLSGQVFLEAYIDLLTNAIEALQDVHTYNDTQLLQAQTKILKLIAAVVILFHPEVEGLGINVNLMQNEPIDKHSSNDKFDSHVYFSDPVRGASSYASVLCVKTWAESPSKPPTNFSLPLDKDPARILFGAPRAFATNKVVVVSNIHSRKEVNKMLDGQPDVVKDAVHAFFAQQRYKTFMSIAVRNSDASVAVLNIQADQSVFGNQARQLEMGKFVDPFCSILGIMAVQSSSRSVSGP